MQIRGKVAVITGAGSGIGRATAERLAGEGASIVAVDIDAAGVRETAARISHAGGNAVPLRADVTNSTDVARMIAVAAERFGGLDILHNNAGVVTGRPGYPEAAPEQWQRVLDINLRAVILGTQLALPALRRRGGGVIVHTASMAGIVGYPPDPIYTATKAGVVMFTHAMGPLAAEGIRVNCVCPGLVDTPMLRRSRESGETVLPADMPMLRPEDVADGVVQLITDDSLAGRALCVAVGLRDFVPLPPYPMPPRPRSA
jgi:NAD(P)-dependent dehydrogenase (short-subunit alcohol dehydrogenase family)